MHTSHDRTRAVPSQKIVVVRRSTYIVRLLRMYHVAPLSRSHPNLVLKRSSFAQSFSSLPLPSDNYRLRYEFSLAPRFCQISLGSAKNIHLSVAIRCDLAGRNVTSAIRYEIQTGNLGAVVTLFAFRLRCKIFWRGL